MNPQGEQPADNATFRSACRNSNAVRYEITNGEVPWNLDFGVAPYQCYWLYRAARHHADEDVSLLNFAFYTTSADLNIANGFPLRYQAVNLDYSGITHPRFRVYLPVAEIDEIVGHGDDITIRSEQPNQSGVASGSRFFTTVSLGGFTPDDPNNAASYTFTTPLGI